MKIVVTATDLARGKRGSASSCPIARAWRRIPGWENVRVGSLVANRGIEHVLLPGSVVAFVTAFDRGRPVKAGSFEVNA